MSDDDQAWQDVRDGKRRPYRARVVLDVIVWCGINAEDARNQAENFFRDVGSAGEPVAVRASRAMRRVRRASKDDDRWVEYRKDAN